MKEGGTDKDSDSKRPPWRSVSVSTLPKPDKNALLRAKLLDASRRLRAGKACVAIQTDLSPTKLTKEINLGIQTDLVILKEAGSLTDGFYKKINKGSDEFVLTYSVGSLTDPVANQDASTQTLLPKLPENWQKRTIGTSPKQIYSHQTLIDSKFPNNESAMKLALLTPTLQSWNFDYGEPEDLNVTTFQPYTISAYKPWDSFLPLTNIPKGKTKEFMHFEHDLYMHAIDELVDKSNALLHIIERTQKRRRNIPKFQINAINFPSNYWLPIIEKEEQELKELQKSYENLKV